jgi:hypothetical protein
MASAVSAAPAASTKTFNIPEEFFIHCAKKELLHLVFDHTKVDALVAEYGIDPAWIDEIHDNAAAYFEAYLIETNQIDTIHGQDEDAIEHIIMCTLVPHLAQIWVKQLQAAYYQDDFENFADALDLDDGDDFFEPAPAAACASAMPVCRFGAHCTRPDCRYTHSTPPAPAAACASAMPVCRFDGHCTRPDCRFTHSTPPTPAACNYGNGCTNRACTYAHPGVPCNGRKCMNGSNCYKRGKSCAFHHPNDACRH